MEMEINRSDITITINGHTDGAPNVVITDHNGSALGANSIAENATTQSSTRRVYRQRSRWTEIYHDWWHDHSDQRTLGFIPDTKNNQVQGTLTLTDYDPVTGKVSYSYQQIVAAKTTVVVILASTIVFNYGDRQCQ